MHVVGICLIAVDCWVPALDCFRCCQHPRVEYLPSTLKTEEGEGNIYLTLTYVFGSCLLRWESQLRLFLLIRELTGGIIKCSSCESSDSELKTPVMKNTLTLSCRCKNIWLLLDLSSWCRISMQSWLMNNICTQCIICWCNITFY